MKIHENAHLYFESKVVHVLSLKFPGHIHLFILEAYTTKNGSTVKP